MVFSSFRLTTQILGITNSLNNSSGARKTAGQTNKRTTAIENPVKTGNGPAAVIGDKTCRTPLAKKRWEGAGIRMNRESEDLPEQSALFPVAREGRLDPFGYLWEIPGSYIYGLGFFMPGP